MGDILDKRNLKKIIEKFKGVKILIIGDLIVDHFVWGNVSRISPEAPVPVVKIKEETYLPGGAGNVANNIQQLGGKSILCGVVGNDLMGTQIIQDLKNRQINTEGIFIDEKKPTILKTRIIAHHQQIVRVDRENEDKISLNLTKKILDYIKIKLKEVKSLIISDYGKGVINHFFLERIIPLAKRENQLIVVDPKIEHFLNYKRIFCLTPNLTEACQGMRLPMVKNKRDLVILGEKILKKLKIKSLLITRGEDGMTLFEVEGKVTHIPTRAREVFDVTGAGDTVVSTLTLSLASGAKMLEAAYLSNFAAGIVVGKLGTASVSSQELSNSLDNY